MKKSTAYKHRLAADGPGAVPSADSRRDNSQLATLDANAPILGRDAAERLIRLTFRLKEQRHQLIPNERIDEAAWCMLLELYLSHLKNTTLYVSALCTNAYASQTTSLRRLEDLINYGFITRQRNHSDSRRISIVLTATGFEKAHAYICHVHSEAFLALSAEISHWRPPEEEHNGNDDRR